VINIAVFASGNGSNAVNLYEYFEHHPSIKVKVIFCNNSKAGIIEKSNQLGIECVLFGRDHWLDGTVLKYLQDRHIDFVVLAGFLWLVPSDFINKFPDRIINIHPALLPSYGGKGMYGMNVHHQVIADKRKESGITIHLVNEAYDKGKILFQISVPIKKEDTAKDLANKIHLLEYENFPKEVEKYITSFGK
jgi:phosphoribosylglycinamide formyltransferase-1